MELLATTGATPREIATAPEAFAIENLGDPARSPSFAQGLWTVQDTGAQLVGLTAAPRAGQKILDACAGVGGKATHLAELADEAAHIDAAAGSKTQIELAAGPAQPRANERRQGQGGERPGPPQGAADD